jgi:hypothetical protein
MVNFSRRDHIRSDIIRSQLAGISIMDDTERYTQQWRAYEMTRFFLGAARKSAHRFTFKPFKNNSTDFPKMFIRGE